MTKAEYAFYLTFGGAFFAALIALEGVVLCATILFFPIGKRFFGLAHCLIFPTRVGVIKRYATGYHAVLNAIWMCTLGWVNFLLFAIVGALCCASVIAIPFGLEFFKAAPVSMFPLSRVFVEDPS